MLPTVCDGSTARSGWLYRPGGPFGQLLFLLTMNWDGADGLYDEPYPGAPGDCADWRYRFDFDWAFWQWVYTNWKLDATDKFFRRSVCVQRPDGTLLLGLDLETAAALLAPPTPSNRWCGRLGTPPAFYRMGDPGHYEVAGWRHRAPDGAPLVFPPGWDRGFAYRPWGPTAREKIDAAVHSFEWAYLCWRESWTLVGGRFASTRARSPWLREHPQGPLYHVSPRYAFRLQDGWDRGIPMADVLQVGTGHGGAPAVTVAPGETLPVPGDNDYNDDPHTHATLDFDMAFWLWVHSRWRAGDLAQHVFEAAGGDYRPVSAEQLEVLFQQQIVQAAQLAPENASGNCRDEISLARKRRRIVTLHVDPGMALADPIRENGFINWSIQRQRLFDWCLAYTRPRSATDQPRLRMTLIEGQQGWDYRGLAQNDRELRVFLPVGWDADVDAATPFQDRIRQWLSRREDTTGVVDSDEDSETVSVDSV